MVRIAEAQWPKEISQKKFLTPQGSYTWAKGQVTKTMENSIMYKMSHTGLTEVRNPRGGVGTDAARRYELGEKKIRLKYFEEVYSTREVLVRVFRVKSQKELDSESLRSTRKKKKKRTKKTVKVESKYKPITNS